MKRKNLLTLAICLGIMAPAAQAQSFWQDAKESAESGWRSAESGLQRAKTTAQSSWERAKETTKAGYAKASWKASDLKNRARSRWASISPETKSNIKKSLIGAGAALGTAAAAGAGYAVYSQYGSTEDTLDTFKTEVTPVSGSGKQLLEDDSLFNDLINLLSKDKAYRGKPDQQRGFLNRFDLDEADKQALLDVIGYAEATTPTA